MEAKHWIRNEKLKKDYTVNNSDSGQTHAILRYLKDMNGVTSIGFHIESSHNSYTSAITTMAGRPLTGHESAKMTADCIRDIAAHNVYALKSTSRDQMFIVSNNSITAKNTSLGAITATTTAAAAAKTLSTKMNGLKRNRVLLDKFIQSIA
jgi:hypothetical protein